ncbi:hypothetical protein ACOME3_008699 [Neoechinorhynchus agilis]
MESVEVLKPQRKIVAVHCPFIIENINEAFRCLGGLERMITCVRNDSSEIQMNLTPSNALIRGAPLVRESRNACYVLNFSTNSDQGDKRRTKVTIIGSVEASYVYRALIDFQYLAFQTTNGVVTSDLRDICDFSQVNEAALSLRKDGGEL